MGPPLLMLLGYASSPKILKEETPSVDPFKNNAEAIIHEASA
jgi:hypothetical protein